MLTITEIFVIIIIHWIADFIMQDEKWALGKSKNWTDLLNHTFTYSICWYIPIIFMFMYLSSNNWENSMYVINSMFFLFITLICHTTTDYFTSRIVSKKFANKEYGSVIPNLGGFTIIGFDQVLHYIQLFTTYYYLKQI